MRVVVTRAVHEWAEVEPERQAWLAGCLRRHVTADRCDLDTDDRAANDAAARHGWGRVLSAYRLPGLLATTTPDRTVWIITDDLKEPDTPPRSSGRATTSQTRPTTTGPLPTGGGLFASCPTPPVTAPKLLTSTPRPDGRISSQKITPEGAQRVRLLVMLSITKLRVGQEAYQLSGVAQSLDDYYTGAGEEHGVWVGGGAARFGLNGDVDPDDLRAVLAGLAPGRGGLTPNGDRPRPHPRRVPGFDLTFKAPKSASVLYAVSDDPRV
jgi:hypothetical protein